MTQNKYVIIYKKGSAENCKETSYHDILDKIWLSFMQGSYNGDYPAILFRNGKIIVSSQLHEIAYKFGNSKRDRINEVTDKTIAEFPEPDTGDVIGYEKAISAAIRAAAEAKE